MDERIGVDAFDRAGERQGRFESPATSLCRCQAENGSKPFTAGEKAVAHRPVDRGRPGALLRQKAVQRAIHFLLSRREVALQFHLAGKVRTSGVVWQTKTPRFDAVRFVSGAALSLSARLFASQHEFDGTHQRPMVQVCLLFLPAHRQHMVRVWFLARSLLMQTSKCRASFYNRRAAMTIAP